MANGFIAEQLMALVHDNNFVDSQLKYFSFLTALILLFLSLLYFSLGLSNDEWREMIKFLIKQIKNVSFYIIKKLPSKRESFVVAQPKQFSERKESNRLLEPKIDFDNLKNQPVSSYLNNNQTDKIVNKQDEIIFEESGYKAPDINFLSKPDGHSKMLFNRRS